MNDILGHNNYTDILFCYICFTTCDFILFFFRLMDNIPEIRIRKGSDEPSIGEQDTFEEPLAPFEALLDLESGSDFPISASLNKPNTTGSASEIHNESIDSGVGGGDTSDMNGGLAMSSMEMDVTEAEEVFKPSIPTAVSPPPEFSNGHDIPQYADNSSSDDNDNGVVDNDEDKDSDDDGLPGDFTPTEDGQADSFGYATLDAADEPDYNDNDQDSEPELDLSLNKAITSGMLSGDDFAFSSFDSPLPDPAKDEQRPEGKEISRKPPPARPPPARPPPPSGKSGPPRPKPPRPVGPAQHPTKDKEMTSFNEKGGAPAKISITLPKHQMKRRPKSPKKTPGPRPSPPKKGPTPALPTAIQGNTSWETFGDHGEKEDEEELKGIG